MKRKALCILSLIAYLLIFCTCLAPTVEREMATLADVKHVKKNTRTNTSLPAYSAQWGKTEGLFQIVEGTGWETGSRVQAIAQHYYSAGAGFLKLHPGTEYTVILSASRTPREGDLVQITESRESPNEQLIVYCPEGVLYMTPLQNNFTVVQQGEKGVLLQTMSIKMPFLEHRMAESLNDRIGAEGMRIYSYSDAEQFLRALPRIAVVLGMLLLGLCFWGCGCRFSQEHRISLWINTGLCALLLICLPGIAGAIDLPASLMPTDSILDLGHYFREFSNIFTVLGQVGDVPLVALRTQMLLSCAAIVAGFLVLAAASAIVQSKLYRKLQKH